MLVVIERTDENTPLMSQLKKHFRYVVVFSSLDVENVIDVGCCYHILTDCKGVTPRSLVINAQFSALEQQLQFSHTGEVHIPNIIIGPHGSLAAVVRNHWCNGREGTEQESGYYSLLPHAEALKIQGNTGALRDLLAYAKRTYEPGEHWQLQELRRDVKIIVQCEEAGPSVVKELRQHFDAVDAQVLSTALRKNNIIDVGCVRFVFTKCGAVAPQSLAVDA